MEAAFWTMVVLKSTTSIMETAWTVVLKSTIVDPVEVQSCLLNVWAWMLEDPVEILDPVVGLPKNYALNPKGEEEEMVAS